MKLQAFMVYCCIWSFTTSGFCLGACQTDQPANHVDEQSEAKQRQTRKLILQFFPDLDTDVIEGWVDSYSSMTETELTQLLQQRRLLGMGGTGFPDLQLNLPKLETEKATTNKLLSKSKSDASPIDQAATIVRNNLSGLQVIGHRERTYHFTHAGHWNQQTISLAIHSSWNFVNGKLHPTSHPLDIAIISDQPIMFRLEPGCVLTRAGRFERLPDGRLGQKVGNEYLTLFPEVKVPESSTDYQITLNGAIKSINSPPDQPPLAQIHLVRIKDTSRLESSNGIYFKVPEPDEVIATVPEKQVAISKGMLELSNVKVSQQQQHLQTLDTMAEAFRSNSSR